MDIKQLLIDIERSELNGIKVRKFNRDFEIYPWIKSRAFNKLILGTEVLQEKDSGLFWQQIKSLSYGFFSAFKRYDAWALTSSSERVLVDGKFVDKVMDPLTYHSKMKLLVIELQLFSSHKRKDVASKHVVSRAMFMFVEEMYARTFLKTPSIENEDLLDKTFEIIGETVDAKAIVKKYLAQYRVMKFFLRMLPKPKVVFLTVSFANFGYIRAWKEAGIKVVEMQHGLIGEGNSGYIYHQDFDPIQFPDDILVFGENDVEMIHQSKIPIKRAIPIGRFVMDLFKKKALPNKTPIQTILVSLQDTEWSILLLDFVMKCNLRSNFHYQWIIQTRRTPESYYRKKYDFPSNVGFSTVSIYEAIGQTDAHLTIYSTTAIESLSIGKPTFLFNANDAAKTYLGQALDSNENTYFCDNEEEFLQAIENVPLRTTDEIADSNALNISSDNAVRTADYIQTIFNEHT